MATLINESDAEPITTLEPLWHRDAPRSLTGDLSSADAIGSWYAWRKHLAKRETPADPKFLKGKSPAILWGWPEAWQRDTLKSLLRLHTKKNRFADSAITEVALERVSGDVELPLALQTVALAYALPRLSRKLPPQTWWRLAERLHELANDAQQQRVDWPGEAHDVLRQQLLGGELPLALSYLFPEVSRLRALGKEARAALGEGLLELTDGEGLPHARLLPVLAPLFACWTRARKLGELQGKRPWSRAAEHQYEWLVRNAIRLADENGRFLLTPLDETFAWNERLLATAIDLAGDKGDAAAAAVAISPRAVPKDVKLKQKKQPDPSLNSDWSGIAVMAGGWSQSDARLALAYADEPLTIELAVDGERLLFGKWLHKTKSNGEAVHVTGEWERLCWESGKRFDYLELGIELSHGLRLERQVLLARDDDILYLADIVIANDNAPRRLHHELSLPLDAPAVWQPEFETRDGVITSGKTRAAVLPLSLKEWRSDPRGGSLYVDSGRFTLSQEAEGRAMCCPVFIDLDYVRSEYERTWRQLTVAEWMEVLPNDVAVGYRAQSGDDQWLFYRSLGPCGNRTLLGQNIVGEFTAGRFFDTGKFKEWVEIESSD